MSKVACSTCCDQLQGPWLLSCDGSPTCREIFADHHWLQLPIKYATDNQPGKKTPTSHELLILSPHLAHQQKAA